MKITLGRERVVVIPSTGSGRGVETRNELVSLTENADGTREVLPLGLILSAADQAAELEDAARAVGITVKELRMRIAKGEKFEV